MNKTTILEINMIDVSLEDRDRELMQLIRRFRFMRTDQLCKIFFSKPEGTERAKLSRTTRCLHRLEKWGVLSHLPRRVRPNRGGTYGLVWRLTETGIRVLNLGRTGAKRQRPYEPSETFLEHTLAVADIYTDIVTLCQSRDYLNILDERIESEAAKTFRYPDSPFVINKEIKVWPDLYVKLQNRDEKGDTVTDRWFIEVDRGTERSKELKEKCERYVIYCKSGRTKKDYGSNPSTLFVVPNERRKEQITAIAKEATEYKKMFYVVTREELADRLLKGPI